LAPTDEIQMIGCPKCRAIVPAFTKTCDCGWNFEGSSARQLTVFSPIKKRLRLFVGALVLALVLGVTFWVTKLKKHVDFRHCSSPLECLAAAEHAHTSNDKESTFVALDRMCNFGVMQACVGLSAVWNIIAANEQTGGIEDAQRAKDFADLGRKALQEVAPLIEKMKQSPTREASQRLSDLIVEEYNWSAYHRLLELMAAFDEPISLVELASYYANGHSDMNIAKDPFKAKSLLKRALAFDHSPALARSQFLLGQIYSEEESLVYNIDAAKDVFSKACENGDANACAELGKAYLHGKRGLMPDANLAFEWFTKGARLQDCVSSAGAVQAYFALGGIDKRIVHAYMTMGAMGGKPDCVAFRDKFESGLNPNQIMEARGVASQILARNSEKIFAPPSDAELKAIGADSKSKNGSSKALDLSDFRIKALDSRTQSIVNRAFLKLKTGAPLQFLSDEELNALSQLKKR
jgi:hypothetical protein